MGLGEGADAAEEVWQPRASVYIGEKEWDEGEGDDERDEILAEERMNVCPAIHTLIYRIAIASERGRMCSRLSKRRRRMVSVLHCGAAAKGIN